MKKLITILLMLVAISANGQWVPINGINGGKIYAILGTSTHIFVGTRGNLYSSSNNGLNWANVGSGLQSCYVWSLANSGQNVYVGLYIGDGVYYTVDNGINWIQMNNGLTNTNVRSLAFSGSNLYAGTSGGGVFLSTSGIGWTPFNNGLGNYNVVSLASSGAYVYAGTYGGGVYISNNGSNWNAINSGLTDLNLRSLEVSGTNLYAGTNDSGIYISTNNGTNWINRSNGLTNKSVWALEKTGTNIFAGTNGSGVFLSTNNGSNWSNINQGLLSQNVYSLYVYNGYLYAGTELSFWRRPLSEIIIGVQNISSEIPTSFSLSQNYPNPFNPTTKIKFDIPRCQRSAISLGGAVEGGWTTLRVYDIKGREVQTLVNERLQPGTYETTFDGSMLNSGVYFYQMVSDDFKQTRKLILLK